jgi:hypothetical protein
MVFSQSRIIRGKKKGPDLAVWACKSTLSGMEETSGGMKKSRVHAMISV